MLRPLRALLRGWILGTLLIPLGTLLIPLGNPLGVTKLRDLPVVGAQFSKKIPGHVLTSIFIHYLLQLILETYVF